jgi:MSHA biogenesis protein MshQ
VRAGDPFDLTVKAVAWVRDGQPLTADNLCSNPVTPNFALSDIGLASTVVAPADGVNAAMKAVSYDHVLGNATKVPESLADVGIFTLTATPKDRAYLNSETVSGGTSAMIGRMIPAYLDVAGSGTLGAACAGAFSYQGQPMAFEAGQSPLLTVTGKTRQDGVTRNYDRGDFWRLATPPRQDYLSDTGKATLDATGRLTATPADITWQPVTDSDVGNGQRQYRRSGESLAYAPPARPTAEDLPFDAKAKLTLAAAALTDRDGACYLGGGAGCRSFDLPISGSEVRLGRLAIGNAYGSELQALALPWRLESWQGAGNGAFALEPGDTCTLPMLGQPALSDAQGHLSAAETSASRADVTLQQGTVQLTAPGKGNDGSVRVGFAATPTWLYYDWNGAGTPTAATGLATFGVYQGAKPLIFRRELYRSQ